MGCACSFFSSILRSAAHGNLRNAPKSTLRTKYLATPPTYVLFRFGRILDYLTAAFLEYAHSLLIMKTAAFVGSC